MSDSNEKINTSIRKWMCTYFLLGGLSVSLGFNAYKLIRDKFTDYNPYDGEIRCSEVVITKIAGGVFNFGVLEVDRKKKYHIVSDGKGNITQVVMIDSYFVKGSMIRSDDNKLYVKGLKSKLEDFVEDDEFLIEKRY